MNEVSIAIYVILTLFNILLFYLLWAYIKYNILYILPIFFVLQSVASAIFAALYNNTDNGDAILVSDSGDEDGLKYIDGKWTAVHPSPHGKVLRVENTNPPGDNKIYMFGSQLIMNSKTIGLETFAPGDTFYFKNQSGEFENKYRIVSITEDSNGSYVFNIENFYPSCQ